MKKKILLADDSITIQKVVEYVLAEEGFDIKIAGDGEEALGLIPDYMPDVVLADIEMPGIDGYRLCKEIKSNPGTGKIPVLLLSGAFEPINKDLSDESGADDCLIKPFEAPELINKVKLLLSKTETTSPYEAASMSGEVQASEYLPEPAEELIPESGAPEEFEAPFAEPADMADNTGFAEAVESEEPEITVETDVVDEKDIAAVPADNLPSREELAGIFAKEVSEKLIKPLLSDIKDAIQPELASSIKVSVEIAVKEIIPGMAEKLLRETLSTLASSLANDIEKIIWKTAPGIAEAIITKEIEKIKSEL